MIDLDQLPVLPRGLRFLARFNASDHFSQRPGTNQSLRQRLAAEVAAAGNALPEGRVMALMSPRVAGYVFNPLSVYWCYHSSGELGLVVAEVHNTYGGRHCYLLRPDALGRAMVRKEFYVSPFNEVDGQYRLSLPEPTADGTVRLAIVLERPDTEPFTATLAGRAEPATVRAILFGQLFAPFAPWRVAVAIRRQGIALWAKKLPIVPRTRLEDTP